MARLGKARQGKGYTTTTNTEKTMTEHPNINDMHTARNWAEHIVNNPETSLPMETAAANADRKSVV